MTRIGRTRCNSPVARTGWDDPDYTGQYILCIDTHVLCAMCYTLPSKTRQYTLWDSHPSAFLSVGGTYLNPRYSKISLSVCRSISSPVFGIRIPALNLTPRLVVDISHRQLRASLTYTFSAYRLLEQLSVNHQWQEWDPPKIPFKHHTARPTQDSSRIPLFWRANKIYTPMQSSFAGELEDYKRFVQVIKVVCRGSDRGIYASVGHVYSSASARVAGMGASEQST
jgi:hypothetical protein